MCRPKQKYNLGTEAIVIIIISGSNSNSNFATKVFNSFDNIIYKEHRGQIRVTFKSVMVVGKTNCLTLIKPCSKS